MAEKFADMLLEGNHRNSLGRAEEIVRIVLNDRARLEELYMALFVEDAWARMRAADALEKVCRVHPEWIEPYIDRLLKDFETGAQPSIQWHMAQIFSEVELLPSQREQAVIWMTKRLHDPDVDWIVAVNCMNTLLQFTEKGIVEKDQLVLLVQHQQKHHSKAVVKRATKILGSL